MYACACVFLLEINGFVKREKERGKERERESLKTASFLLPVQDHIPHGLLAAVTRHTGGKPVAGVIWAENAML